MPYFAQVSSGFTLLNTVTGNGVAALSDTTSFTSKYETYKLILANILPANAGTNYKLELTENSGGAWGAFANCYTSFAAAQLIPDNTAGQGGSGEIQINSLNSTTLNKQASGFMTAVAGAGPAVAFWGGTYLTDANAANGFRVKMAAGNISGIMYVYGLQK